LVHGSCRRAFLALALFGLFVCGGPSRAAGPVSVRLLDRTEIGEDQVLLGRIARIDGDDAALVGTLRGLVLGRAPLPGKSRTLDADFIHLRLRQCGIDPAALDLQIPAEAVVTRAMIEIGRERIEEIVREFVARQSAGRPEPVRLKEVRNVEPPALPPGRLHYEVSAPRNAVLSGTVPLSIQFRVNDDFEKRIWVTAVLESRAAAVVSRRPLGRLKPIEEDDVEVRAVELGELPADYITDVDALIGKRARRAIDANTVLRPDLVESAPVVKRGDRVVIIAETKGLRITAVGQAKQKGAPGERIPVVNLDSNRVIQAQVVDGRTVRIEF
jgi:flagella basal body P-ring formation protein FlgA